MANHSEKESVRRFLSKSGTIRITALVADKLVAEMQNIQQSTPLASVAMGRLTLAAAMLASHSKDGKVGLHFQGNGPLGSLFVEASFDGKIRGYVQNPNADLALNEGKIDISGGVGIGLMNVVRTLPHQKQPFSGTVIIKTGEIAGDVAYYLEQSHQIPSIVALGEHVNEYGFVTTAGGVIIELMPGHTELELGVLEKNLEEAKSMSKMLLDNTDLKNIVNEYTKGIEVYEIEHEYALSYSCTCNQDKVDASITFLETYDLEQMLQEDKPAEVKCEFCSKEYSVSVETINEVYRSKKKQGLH
ncbi:MAG: Hsp33 family molecular chaperone HslO [Bdellovibrionales bacterium]